MDQLELTELTYKFIVIGSTGVGKSCLLLRYAKNEFTSSHYPTIGMEFFSKRILVNNVMLKLQIWDTAGQETFKSIVRNFYKGSHAVFLVYSITDRKSFDQIQDWMEQAKMHAPQNAVFILVGAQKDQEHRREVSAQEGKAKLQKHNLLLFFETSAKNDQNVDLAFEETAKTIMLEGIFKTQYEQPPLKLLKLDGSQTGDAHQQSTCC